MICLNQHETCVQWTTFCPLHHSNTVQPVALARQRALEHHLRVARYAAIAGMAATRSFRADSRGNAANTVGSKACNLRARQARTSNTLASVNPQPHAHVRNAEHRDISVGHSNAGVPHATTAFKQLLQAAALAWHVTQAKHGPKQEVVHNDAPKPERSKRLEQIGTGSRATFFRSIRGSRQRARELVQVLRRKSSGMQQQNYWTFVVRRRARTSRTTSTTNASSVSCRVQTSFARDVHLNRL